MLMRAGIFTADVFAQSENSLFVPQHITEPLQDPNKSAIKGSCDLSNSRYNREQRPDNELEIYEDASSPGLSRKRL